MEEFKGTKGRWELNPLRDPTNPTYWCLYTQNETNIEHIAIISNDGLSNTREAKPNAQLIACAPELLNELINLVRIMDNKEISEYVTSSARDVINKALGKETEK